MVKFSTPLSLAVAHMLRLLVPLKVRSLSPQLEHWHIYCFLSPVNPGSNVFEPESACEQVIYSGGGFSNYFRLPKYQEAAVQSYLKKNPPPYPLTTYNSTGKSRGYPDLSANGANYVVSVRHAHTSNPSGNRFPNTYIPNRSKANFRLYTAHQPARLSSEPS